MGSVKGPHNVWSNIELCHTNDFGYKNEKIAKWLDYRGGSCARSITSHTTHLVCSELAWKNKHSLVKTALENPEIQIVTFDWLEDSLMSKSRKPKRIINKYRWGAVEKAERLKSERRRVNKQKQVDEKVNQYVKRCNDIFKDVQVANYHIFNDPTGFDYTTTLSQISISLNSVAWQNLKLCESNASPPGYFVYVKRSPVPPLTRPESVTLTTVGVPFETAIKTFKVYFRKCTGLEWEVRMDATPNYVNGEGGERMWVYKPPENGETVGLLPPGREHLQTKRKRHAERDDETVKKKAKKLAYIENLQPKNVVGLNVGRVGEQGPGNTEAKTKTKTKTKTGKVWMGSLCGEFQSGEVGRTRRSGKVPELIEID